MHNINPDDLDAIFREGADQHEFTYNEAAWQDMSGKLDKRDRNRKLVIFFLAAFSVIVGISIYNISIDSNDNQSSMVIAAIDDLGDSKSFDGVKSTAKATTDGDASTLGIAVDRDQTLVEGEEVTAHVASPSSTEQKNSAKPGLNDNRAKRSVKSVRNSTEKETLQREPEFATGGVSTNLPSYTYVINSKEVNNSFPKQITRLDRTQSTAILIPAIDLAYIPIEERSLSNLTVANVVSDESPAIVSQAKYYVGVYGGPEWSTIGAISEATTGWKAGLSFGLPISTKLDIVSGVGISRKIYTASDPDYTMSDGWVADRKPISMDSKGYIIDIPLDLKYYLTDRSENSFFIETGLSSYFMSSEWYGFEYDASDMAFFVDNNIEPIDEVFDQNINHHFFSIANLSLGYQHKVNQSTHLEIAPYVQIPLTGIGSGDVDLFTTGIRLGIRFSK